MAELTPLEIASGLPFGIDPHAPRLPKHRRGVSAREALEQAMIPALEGHPCVLAFSGGRDSSAMLAIAVQVARREDLPEPVPVTLRFPGAPRAEESEWQELVVRHLRIEEWEKIELTDELDLLGPYAQRAMLAIGLIWPANAMAQVPIYEAARGGSVITGLGGDGVFSSWRWKLVDELLARPWKAKIAHLRTAGSALMPKSVRQRRAARRWTMPPPWLRPEARREVTRLWAHHNARQPVSWRGYVDYIARARYHALMLETLSRLAEGSGARTFHPMLDPAFLSALAAEWRPGRFSSRTAVMHHLFADLLPAEMVSRPTKGEFTQAFFGQRSREFARKWDGAKGVDKTLVDPERLRSFWLDDDLRDFRCSTALQSAWLASRNGGI